MLVPPAPPPRDRTKGFERRAATLEVSLRRSQTGGFSATNTDAGPTAVPSAPAKAADEGNYNSVELRNPNGSSPTGAAYRRRTPPATSPARQVPAPQGAPTLRQPTPPPRQSSPTAREPRSPTYWTPSSQSETDKAARVDAGYGLRSIRGEHLPSRQPRERRATTKHSDPESPPSNKHNQAGRAARPVYINPSPIVSEQSFAAKPPPEYWSSSQGQRKVASPYGDDVRDVVSKRPQRHARHATSPEGREESAEEGIPVPGAAGTATRTLREQIAQLQKTKDELEAQQRVKDEENHFLRQKVARLEAVMLEGDDSCSPTDASQVAGPLRQRISQELSPATLFSSPEKAEDGPDFGIPPCGGRDGDSASPSSPNQTLIGFKSGDLDSITPSTAGGSRRKNSVHYAAKAIREADLLRKDLSRCQDNYNGLMKEYEVLEQNLQDVQRTASGYAARYAFCLLDEDHDGLIGFEEVVRYELFMPYSLSTLQHCYRHWQFVERPGRMTSDDFLNFTQFAEDKTNRASQLFWFSCADIDGDGMISRLDARWLYDQVDKSNGCVGFDDIFGQLLDMSNAKDRDRGITLQEIRDSKLATGIFGILFNHNNLLLRRTTAEFSMRNEAPL
eukprot:CAMPEP_0118922614 /NCGR_PEP_ID=MMETSP1169-20130426/1486_1 /TAXON_ID=36882 /ORGANISM="Pyramimonas obovata, Strain CCMP722" /LENGTH=617 /DNA_ID=CAMNT_0006863523 /DNA_START=184 /DNA_END=2037 /DNA_ORIENTATION=+